MEPLDRAREWLEAGRPSRALRILRRVSTAPSPIRPERDFLMAEAWRAQGFFAKAERGYQKVLRRTSAEVDPILWIEAALGSAAGRRSVGDVQVARSRLREVRGLCASLHLSQYDFRIRLEGALADRAAGRFDRCLAELGRLYNRCFHGGEWSEAAFLLWAIGGAHRVRGALAASRRAFRKSLALAHRAGDPIGEGYALFGLGGVTRVMGRIKESARYYTLARDRFERTEDLFGKAYAHCGLANALRQLGLWRRAASEYRLSWRLYRRLEDWVDLAYVEWGLGKIHLACGDLGSAFLRLERSRRLFHRYAETRGLVLAEVALSQLLHARGRTSQAERLLEGAWRRARKAGIHTHLEVYT